MKIGVISDTHGYLNPNVFPLFDGVDQILHAGDIGSEDIITSLEAIAPVQAIHGNVDIFPLSTRYPEALALNIEGVTICLVHQFINLRSSSIRNALDRLQSGKLDLLIHGHTHEAKLTEDEGVTLFNPGSAGKPRFALKPAVGLLTVESGKFEARIKYMQPA